jgi:hypothetical protein
VDHLVHVTRSVGGSGLVGRGAGSSGSSVAAVPPVRGSLGRAPKGVASHRR